MASILSTCVLLVCAQGLDGGEGDWPIETVPVDAGAEDVADAGLVAPERAADLPSELSPWSSAFTSGVTAWSTSSVTQLSPFAHVRVGARQQWRTFEASFQASVLFQPTWTPTSPQPPSLRPVAVLDLGSRIELGWHPAPDSALRFTVIPFDSGTALVSYDWALAWGQRTPPAPLFRVSWETSRFGVAAAARFKLDPATQERGSLFPDALVTGWVRVSEFLLELRATQVEAAPPAVAMAPARTFSGAGTARLTWRRGDDPGEPMDFVTWKTDPTRFERLVAPPVSTGGRAVVVVLGGGYGLVDAVDPTTFTLSRLPVWWAEGHARARLEAVRLFAYLRARSTTALLGNVQLNVTHFAFTTDAALSPELSAVTGADYRFRSTGLTPGLLVRVVRPAFSVTPRFNFGGTNPPPGPTDPPTAVWETDGLQVVPAGMAPGVIVALQASLRAELSPHATLVAEFDVAHDPNRYRFVDSTTVPPAPTQSSPWVLNGLIALQVRP
jgi:hypothetical protein